MTEYNPYLKYSFKRIKQSSNSPLGFDIWWLNLFVKSNKSNQDLCFARNLNLGVHCEARFGDLML